MTGHVRAVEFTTSVDGATSSGTLDLSEYGEDFDIQPPEGVVS